MIIATFKLDFGKKMDTKTKIKAVRWFVSCSKKKKKRDKNKSCQMVCKLLKKKKKKERKIKKVTLQR